MSATLLVYANCQADEMVSFLQRSPAMSRRSGVERVFLGALHEFIAQHGHAQAEARLARVTMVWEQSSRASPDERDLMRRLIPSSARWIRFPALSCSTLWPFYGADPRPQANLIYPYSDRLAARLWRELGGASGDLDAFDDDTLFERYWERSVDKMPDLEHLLEFDLVQWRERDLDSDIPIADMLKEELRLRQLFHTAGRGSWASSGEILRRLVSESIDDPTARTEILADLQLMGEHYAGNDSISMPIHPLVGERLNLRWYQPDAVHNWFSYQLDFRAFVLRCIRLHDLR